MGCCPPAGAALTAAAPYLSKSPFLLKERGRSGRADECADAVSRHRMLKPGSKQLGEKAAGNGTAGKKRTQENWMLFGPHWLYCQKLPQNFQNTTETRNIKHIPRIGLKWLCFDSLKNYQLVTDSDTQIEKMAFCELTDCRFLKWHNTNQTELNKTPSMVTTQRRSAKTARISLA